MQSSHKEHTTQDLKTFNKRNIRVRTKKNQEQLKIN